MGHMQIAALAFDRLDPSVKAKVANIRWTRFFNLIR
jgi:hypothetical protein